MGADPGNREEQRRRELEEIRRSFTEIGVRMGSLFEPAQQDRDGAAEAQEAQEPAVVPAPAGRRTPSWTVAAVIALVCLLAGGGLGYLLHRPAAAAAPEPIPTAITSVGPNQTGRPARLPAGRAAWRRDHRPAGEKHP